MTLTPIALVSFGLVPIVTNANPVAIYVASMALIAAATAGVVMAMLRGGLRSALAFAVLIAIAGAPGLVTNFAGPGSVPRAIGVATPFAQLATFTFGFVLGRRARPHE